ncbi:MAG: RIP metalloprotease RseP [Rickettsiales bacterium]|nr:RIP metalloprotease RseP [Rickettsiales bacterium]
MIETLYNILSFLLVISIIVFTHELGHYIAARIFGVKVIDFAIGWGPKIFSIKDKAGTNWKLCAIPIGGYIKYFGDTNISSISSTGKKLSEKEKKQSFVAQSSWKKSIMAAAGPMGNFLVAIIIFTYFFAFHGKLVSENEVTFVAPNSVAQREGIEIGDRIKKIEGSEVSDFSDIERYVKTSPNIPLHLEIERNGQVIKKIITPEAVEIENDVEKITIGKIGIGSNKVRREVYSLPKAVIVSVQEVIKTSVFTLKSLGQMITGHRGTKELASVIRISKYSGMVIKQSFASFIWFIAILSINLGLVNLFPVPPLDGGHIFLYAVKGITSKKIYNYIELYTVRIGIVLLIALMIFGLFNDIFYTK